LGALTLSNGAFAQETVASDEDRARARTLFGEGVQASERSDWDAAAAKFEAALALVGAPAVQYNLAAAYFELGRLGEAGDLVADVLTNPEVDAALHDQAQALDAQIAERSGRLTVEVAPEGNEGARVRVDGRELPASRVGLARHETPGQRTVELSRVDGSTESQRVDVPAGGEARASFGPADAGGGDGAGLLADPVFWAVAGGVALFIGTIAIVAVAAASTSGPRTPDPPAGGGVMALHF
jgi:hypothetical protein